MGSLFFSTIDVTRQVFYCSSLSFAAVNLKPIVPGHVLVIPTRVVPRLADLNAAELSSLMSSVQHVGRIIERVYGADALTIACQDGKAAGQTMPHVHFHLLPRKHHGDRFSERNDEIYPALEHAEGQLPQQLAAPQSDEPQFVQDAESIKMDADEDRQPRSMEDMIKEAAWLSGFFRDIEHSSSSVH